MEGALKMIRSHGNSVGGGKTEIIALENSFHGRTLAGISATGQEKVKHGFEPPVEGFRHVPFNDLDAVAKAVTPKTVAILLEPISSAAMTEPLGFGLCFICIMRWSVVGLEFPV